MGRTEEFKDGRWVEAEPIKFEYGLFWKIIKKIKFYLRGFICSHKGRK